MDKLIRNKFELLIGLDNSDENQNLITNIVPFMNIEDATDKDFLVKIKYELAETTKFNEKVKKIIRDYSEKYIRFQKYLKAIDGEKKQLEFYNSSGYPVDNRKFNLSDLVQLKTIVANKVINDKCLSKIFNKIVQYKYNAENLEEIGKQIDAINEGITDKVSSSPTPDKI